MAFLHVLCYNNNMSWNKRHSRLEIDDFGVSTFFRDLLRLETDDFGVEGVFNSDRPENA